MRGVFCSTGTMVGRINGFNYSLISKNFPSLFEKGLISGGEFIVLSAYYDNIKNVCKEVKNTGVPFDVLHCDKDIGIMFSEHDDKITEKALTLLKRNCEVASELGCTRMVFHLWGAPKSDSAIEYNISLIPRVLEITDDAKIRLMIENIPCTNASGLENWRKLYKYLPRLSFIFDTRFGAFHDETEKILDEPIWEHINHMHISDYGAAPRDFSKIRPILHPGEGKIDFDHIFSRLAKSGYEGTFTLESPVMTPYETDIPKLEKSLSYLNVMAKKYGLL